MASLTIPNSSQLRLGFRYRNSSFTFSRTRLRTNSDRRIRSLATASGSASEGDGSDRNLTGNSRKNSDKSNDNFSSWFGADSGGSQRKGGFGGIIGASVAGVVLAAGLAFASISLSKQSTSGLKPEMKPLAVQQELLLNSGDQDDRVELVRNKDNTVMSDGGSLHSDYSPECKTGIIKDSPSSPEITEATSECSTDETSLIENVESASSGIDATTNASSPDDLQFRPAVNEISIPSNSNMSSSSLPEYNVVDGSSNVSSFKESGGDPAAALPDLAMELNVVNPSVSDADSTNLNSYYQEGITILREIENSKLPSDFSGSGQHIPDMPLAFDHSISPESDLLPDSQAKSKDVTETVASLSNKEDLNLSKTLQVPNEGISSALEGNNLDDAEPSGKNTLSVLAGPIVNEPSTDDYIEIDRSKELSGSPIPKSSSSAAGIPASGQHIPDTPLAFDDSISPESDLLPDSQAKSKDVTETVAPLSIKDLNLSKTLQVPNEGISSTLEGNNLDDAEPSGKNSLSVLAGPIANEPRTDDYTEIDRSKELSGSPKPKGSSSSAGIPAPSLVSAALKVPPGKVLVPAVVDQVQGQAFAALQVLKVIEVGVQPGDLCTRREYVRWLVSASSALSRNTVSKVYPAMYIENVTALAFDDITPEDPDFPSIQGLAEAGLISSKLSRCDILSYIDEEPKPFFFSPESTLSRQDLVCWKMALDERQLQEVERQIMYQRSGFLDIDKINPDAWPALVADLSDGEQGIIALAFGYTRLFQPDKPVTKAQAAISLAIGEAADILSEELTRIEEESMAETAVAAHSALVTQVEKDVIATFEKELSMEKVKIDAVEKLAESSRLELERLKSEREEENNALLRGRATVETELEVLSQLRREVEEQLQIFMSNKMEISFERKRMDKLRKEAESENQAIARLQYELEVEKKALSMARAWAEDEAKRLREQAKALEEARDRWERHGIKVVVNSDLKNQANAGVTWMEAGKQSTVKTVDRAEKLVDNLKAMTHEIKGNAKAMVEKIIEKITYLITILKEWVAEATIRTGETQGAAVLKVSEYMQRLQQNTGTLQDGAKRVAGDCREGVEKLTQKFKA